MESSKAGENWICGEGSGYGAHTFYAMEMGEYLEISSHYRLVDLCTDAQALMPSLLPRLPVGPERAVLKHR